MPSAPCAERALLVVVAHHPPAEHVIRLQQCLQGLPPGVVYGVVINDYLPGEPAEALLSGAAITLVQQQNPGYGRGFNQLWQDWLASHADPPPLVAVLNTDLSWSMGAMERLVAWMEAHPDVTAAAPLLRFPNGRMQYLCKRNPTLLALFSRRVIPKWCKPSLLKRYDSWFTMQDHDYQTVFTTSYLSGCCLLMRGWALDLEQGFDPRFFLYFEDADITRRLGRHGRTVHLPVAEVMHHWGRGSYISFGLTMVNLHSAWIYFRKWGWRWW